MSVSSLPISLLIWGGSPKRILKKPDGLSADEIEKIIGYDRFLCSNSPDLLKSQESGELSWVDVPGNTPTKRYFILSTLSGDPGSRPLWFFFCLIIERENWERMESHRRLLKALEEAPSSSLFDLLMGAGAEITLTLPDESSKVLSRLGFPLPKKLRMNQEEALSQIEKHFSLMEGRNFFQSRLAWNPASLSGEWTCVIQTRDARIRLLQERPLMKKDTPGQSALSGLDGIQKIGKRKKSERRKILLFAFLLILAGSMFFITSFWETKPIAPLSPELKIPPRVR